MTVSLYLSHLSICRLVHSDGSLVDLSTGGAPQLLLEEEKGLQKEREEEETEEKCIKDEEDEYPCIFDGETLSDHITGKHGVCRT